MMADADPYSADIVSWAREQAALLRRLAAGEHVGNQIDWAHVVAEIETVGRSEVRAVSRALIRAMQHKLYLLGWPAADRARRWQADVRIHLAEAHEDFRESMRQEIEPNFPDLYRLACLDAACHMPDAPTVDLPAQCLWTLDELLAEGKKALRHDAPQP